jgi:predicted metal-dependent enzyme (double-stranded beta helix superfamily)
VESNSVLWPIVTRSPTSFRTSIELRAPKAHKQKSSRQAKPLLADLVQNPNCIEPRFKQHGGKIYGRYMLHRAPLFNVTSVVWGPGDSAKAHNHDTWGLVGVLENELQETRFQRRDDGTKDGYAELEITAVNRNKAGMVSTLLAAEDDIHEMLNVTQKNTIEVHVYGKDLANMPRLQFDYRQSRREVFRQREIRQLLISA